MEENEGLISSIMTQIVGINNSMSQVVGVEPILIISVVALVSMIDISFKIRKRYSEKADKMLLGLCVLMSVLVSVFSIENIETWKQVSRHAFILSGMTTLSYKFGKPIVKRIVVSRLKKMEVSDSPSE